MLSRSPGKIIALRALLLMSPRLGLRKGLGRFGAELPHRPRLYPLVQRDTRTAGYPRPLGSPARGISARGAVDKTMQWVVMKLSMDLTFYKFQANNRTPQCVSITNAVLCTQRSRINIYLLWTNNYFRHYKILKINLFVYMGSKFLFSTGHICYHVFRAGVGRTRQRCNRHKISTADFRFRGSRLTRAITITAFACRGDYIS